ncbi:hypothetical protein [Nocardia sp. CC201C]|uniref:hypothetical protein n=1 Tax=Nocardia sp. CC201C TaxID=3044575 RepID=UPI0024A99470|nr:hypothetical protein [Nocardia sp. CC201C]
MAWNKQEWAAERISNEILWLVDAAEQMDRSDVQAVAAAIAIRAMRGDYLEPPDDVDVADGGVS